MSANTVVTLELTQREAKNLMALTLRAIAWGWAGETEVGTDAEAVYRALQNAGFDESDARPIKPASGPGGIPRWADNKSKAVKS